MIFSSAVQIIKQEASVEDINRCLELIRFSHLSRDFLVKVIRNHSLMKEPPRDRYVSEALLYQLNKTSASGVQLPRYWGRSEKSGIYYIGKGCCIYQYVSKAGNNECLKRINFPGFVNINSSVASYREQVVILGTWNRGHGEERALLLDMTGSTKITQLPDLPKPHCKTSAVLSDNDVYVVEGYNRNSGCLSSVYYLSLGSDAWQTKKSMSRAACRTLVIQH